MGIENLQFAYETKYLLYQSNSIKKITNYSNLIPDSRFIHIVENYELNDKMSVLDKNSPVFASNVLPDILYNVVYTSTHPDCYGDKFIVIQVIKQNSKFDPDSVFYLLRVYFLGTDVILTVNYKHFKSGNIYNPYSSFKLFPGYSFGNINLDLHTYDLGIWFEVISRLADPNHPLYPVFGGAGVVPGIPELYCFEYYVHMNKAFLAKGNRGFWNPNDTRFYRQPYYMNNINSIFSAHNKYGALNGYRDAAKLNRFEFPYIEEGMTYNITLKDNTKSEFDRTTASYDMYARNKHAGGRPSKNPKPSKIEEKPKQKMYHVVNDFMLDRFEANFK